MRSPNRRGFEVSSPFYVRFGSFTFFGFLRRGGFSPFAAAASEAAAYAASASRAASSSRRARSTASCISRAALAAASASAESVSASSSRYGPYGPLRIETRRPETGSVPSAFGNVPPPSSSLCVELSDCVCPHAG